MAKTVAGAIFVLLVALLIGVHREGGSAAVRSWFKAKLLNNPSARPQRPARRVSR